MTQTLALLITILCVMMIALGQILFKVVATRSMNEANIGVFAQWLNWPMFGALVIYGVATVLWIWVLRFVPLNIAYPVFALAFIIVPVASYYVFKEPLGTHHLLGGLLILAGVFVITKGGQP